MFDYLCSLREFTNEELSVISKLCEICEKYDELHKRFQANPSDKLLVASKQLDQMRWETAKSLKLCTLRGDFTQPTRHVFCLESDLLAQL